ncbi:MaoC family dehydratase N-terminal domain-containing protein [Amycolatopsis rhabdoformis]|uniref:MaoC family dehydratase N-terminal domain-containing protein n=1 Tax=Amycolatopsis rhabdoformis TaxID=1448059 RepID=A0ABZ1I808_9PSEU|nr:MaoC family dehydratase N-terminal domain-containing protein [Amycolatopsis rhabdoformis]WSE29659.1 MaoC family dehydratase N-terminal domain-containing protein [Amycolatopsis rhabdoformis]
MALDRTYLGRSYPPTEPYEVGREKIREFWLALGGESGEVAPPTFPIVLSMEAERQVHFDPAFGLDFGRVVHREQEFAATRAIRAGDRLTVVVTVVDVADAAGHDVVTLRSDIITVEGERVCTATSTMVAVAGD